MNFHSRRDFLKLLVTGLCGAFLPAGLSRAAAAIEGIPGLNHWLPIIAGENFNFLGIGDMGTGWSTEKQLVKLMEDESANQAVILLGDIAYPQADPKSFKKGFLEPFKPLYKKGLRFYPVLGNHDWLYQKAYVIREHFRIPSYYSFHLGPAAFWMLNSNDFDKEQADWLNSSLTNTRASWKIVCLHHSPYSSGIVHKNDSHLVKNLCPIMERQGVDLCLSGHNHLYERARIKGVCHIVSGGGSASLHNYLSVQSSFERDAIEKVHHYIRCRGDQNNIILEAVNINGQVFDRWHKRK